MAEQEGAQEMAKEAQKTKKMTVAEAVELLRQTDGRWNNTVERDRIKEAKAVLASQEVQRVKG